MKSNHSIKIISLLIVPAILLAILFTGCSNAETIGRNISNDADNFNTERRLVVVNLRTDTVLLELIGTFSVQNNTSDELEVICKLNDDNEYYKHLVQLQDDTTYFIEDLSHAHLDKYEYKFTLYPNELSVFPAR